MPPLARRNLFHDKVRLGVTLTGIAFSLVLIAVQTGLFFGFAETTSHVIDHSSADLWISSAGLQNFDSGAPFSERKLHQVLATEGVATAEKYIVQFGVWKKRDGGEEGVEIVGFDPRRSMGGPWNVVAGRISDLRAADTVFIDELFMEKLGISQVGQTAEINGRRARVAGLTRGVRSFTTNPFVFTSFKNALGYSRLREDRTVYVLAKLKENADAGAVKQRLLSRITDVDVYTTRELSSKTRFYWMITTGAGMTLIIAAVLGLVVGVVVVAQTIYATTIDHIREFGTLKALGASNGYLYRVIMVQAAYSAVLGYILGISACCAIAYASRDAMVSIVLTWPMAIALFFLTLGMCVTASIVSISRITQLDPGSVFRA